jgi:penicillin-binding protein A
VNAPLRRVGVVVLLLFALLFANLNWVQAYHARDYATNDFNGRVQTEQYQRQRGTILLSDGQTVVAQSVETTDTLKYLRKYPIPTEFAHVIGYKPVNGATTGIEKWQDQFLAGEADSQIADRIVGMFTNSKSAGGNVILTINKAVQDAAFKGLTTTEKTKRGAVVALNPKTGAVLAAVSIPTFDANPLVSHDGGQAEVAYTQLNKDTNKPLLSRAFSDTYPPGSTFKVITSATALANGLNPQSQLVGGPDYKPPQTSQTLHNASGVDCPEQITLKRSLTVSCNTAFARLCVEQLGADKIKSMAQAFGFESEPRIDGDEKNVMSVVPSHTGSMTRPDGQVDPPVLAQSCIGQRDVRMTPLQGALVAATVANGGRQMRPYLVEALQGPDLSRTQIGGGHELRQPFDDRVAADLQDMMISVVTDGTGKNARIDGFRVGGKTGTADTEEGAQAHGWFIGFAMRGNEPLVAVAVFLEGAGRGGSSEAAKIAGQVMKATLGAQK